MAPLWAAGRASAGGMNSAWGGQAAPALLEAEGAGNQLEQDIGLNQPLLVQ